ncbi:hypothetical protein DL96DRAFT_1666391 [Flagelloscypha sp. PMI_526]|nr:hypothetical protein DL96DRAFT_1666391 [Flagelloscypha sp. PMI_526]
MDFRHNFVSINCVNVGIGNSGTTPMVFLVSPLAPSQIALVDFLGNVLLDTYVSPQSRVTEYRTAHTGYTSCVSFHTVQSKMLALLKGKILVGHCLWLDLSVLGISHPARDTRDVALYQPFRNALTGPSAVPGLYTLSWTFMQRRSCDGTQNPVECSRVALDLWRSQRLEWEKAISSMNWPCALPPAQYARCFT